MKFSRFGQVSLVSTVALILTSTFTACSPITIDYVFVAGNKANPGEIEVYLSDRVSGALSKVGSPVSSGGVNPVSEAVSTDFSHLYVANKGDSTLVEFNIAGNGALTAAKTVNMSAEGNTPVAITMNASGTLLYVANFYRPGCSDSKPCGGALAVFPVGKDGSLGSAVTNGSLSYFPIGVNPTAVAALSDGSAVYVSDYNTASGIGYLDGFAATTAGALTAIPGSPFPAGVKPVGIGTENTSRFVYVTDFAQNELIAYSVIDQGVLHPLINGPFKTGNQPSAIVVDPRGKYIYVANQLDNSVSAYAIDVSTGTPSAAVNTTGATTNTTGTEPVAILVDPGFGRYVYTANFLDNSLSGFHLNSSTGTLTITSNGPYPTVGQPSALASVPHGNHATQVSQP